MKIESQDTNVEALLQSCFLNIPRFQRPYSWEQEHIEEFWKDITNNESEDYFIGSMVIYNSGRQEYGVVDGQQRLTTITVLLCAIRDNFAAIGAQNLADGLHSLIERADRDNNKTYILKTETSYPYFQETIQKFGPPEIDELPSQEETNLKTAYDLFCNKISMALTIIDAKLDLEIHEIFELKSSYLKKIRDYVLFLKLIKIELENEDDAYIIFETINTRGKDLALTDLVKNHFTRILKKNNDVDPIKIKWNKIIEQIRESSDDLDTDTFIVHSWASRFDPTTKQKAYKAIKSTIKKENAKKHLDDFLNDSALYRSIFDTKSCWSKNEDDARKSLDALRTFRVTQQTPAVLSLVRAYRAGLIRLGALARALSAIEKFHFIFTAITSSRSSGGISAMYTSLGRRLYECEDSNAAGVVINDLIARLKEKVPTYSEFSASFEQKRYSKHHQSETRLVRYILEKISQHYQLSFDRSIEELTIEHIQPQSESGKNWPVEYIGQIGNLILLTKNQNSAVDNMEFSKKLPIFKSFKQSVPAFVLEQKEWTLEIIKERTRLLSEVSYNNIWKID